MNGRAQLAGKTINRRQLVAGASAGLAAAGLASLAWPGMARASAISGAANHSCAAAHPALSAELGRFICDPANDAATVNRALRATHCPDCGTRLSADLSRYALNLRTA